MGAENFSELIGKAKSAKAIEDLAKREAEHAIAAEKERVATEMRETLESMDRFTGSISTFFSQSPNPEVVELVLGETHPTPRIINRFSSWYYTHIQPEYEEGQFVGDLETDVDISMLKSAYKRGGLHEVTYSLRGWDLGIGESKWKTVHRSIVDYRGENVTIVRLPCSRTYLTESGALLIIPSVMEWSSMEWSSEHEGYIDVPFSRKEPDYNSRREALRTEESPMLITYGDLPDYSESLMRMTHDLSKGFYPPDGEVAIPVPHPAADHYDALSYRLAEILVDQGLA